MDAEKHLRSLHPKAKITMLPPNMNVIHFRDNNGGSEYLDLILSDCKTFCYSLPVPALDNSKTVYFSLVTKKRIYHKKRKKK